MHATRNKYSFKYIYYRAFGEKSGENNKIANCKPFPKHVDTDRNQNNNTADYRSISKACRHREKSEQ